MIVLHTGQLEGETWEDYYQFRWDALEADINYYSTMLEDWDE
jgi:hypothetical protein